MLSMFELNVLVELWCAAFCVICMLCVRLFFREQLWDRDLLITLFVLVFVSSASDVVALGLLGYDSRVAWGFARFLRVVSFVTEFATAGAFTSYLCSRVDPDGRRINWWVKTAWVASVLGALMGILDVLIGFDPMADVYQRSILYWLAQLLGMCIIVGDIFVLLALGRKVPRATLATLLICLLLPGIALFCQSFIPELNLLRLSMVISLMMLFFEMQAYIAILIARQRERIALQERELSESRVQIMVSQIQPHFLYNTLDSIYYLCRKDPDGAREAISRFSDYLRQNLRSLTTDKLVPFETELEHVRNYLELEHMSSDDTIGFVVDAQAHGFLLPALSLQPLVENAVKHGLGGKDGGGTVWLSSRELNNCFEVVVMDDGAGFDTSAELDPSRPHVGIQNVRQRLSAMCDGTLEVMSEPGKGTTAVVRIPKKGADGA